MKKLLLLLFPLSVWAQTPVSDTQIKTNTDFLIRKARAITPANHALINDQLTDSKVSILAPKLLTSSNSGYVWTASDNAGNGGWQALPPSITQFQLLTDGPGPFTSHGLNYPRVNSGATALEYRTPSQTLSDISGVPTSRILTINGTSLDLTADRTWTISTATNLSSLTDANIATPTNNQFLQYQTSDNKWHNHTLVAGDIPILNQNTTGSAGSVLNSITFNNSGTGAASGTTFNGSSAQTISYNTLGAAPATSGTALLKANGSGGFTSATASDVPGTANLAVTNSMIANSTIDLTAKVTGLLPIANGGTGTTTPGIVAGTNITVTGTWPNQTVSASGAATPWNLASGGTLTGANTITSNTANQLLFNGTWTATANNQNHLEMSGSITARATASDVLRYLVIDPTLTSAAATQTLMAALINPTFTDVNSATKYILRIQNAGSDRATFGFDGATSIVSGNSSTNPTLKLTGIGTGTNYTLRAFQSNGTTETMSLKDNGLIAFTPTINGSVLTSTWTATANNQNAFEFNGTVTSENVASDNIFYTVVDPTLTRNAGNPATQIAVGFYVNPSFTNSFSQSLSAIFTGRTAIGTFASATNGTFVNDLFTVAGGNARFVPAANTGGILLSDASVSRTAFFVPQTIAGGSGNAIYNNSAIQFDFGTNSLARMSITGSTGNILIGSTTDNARLYVSQAALSSSQVPAFRVDVGAHTAIALNSEYNLSKITAATLTWTDGTTSIERVNFDDAITLNGTTTLATFTDAYGRYTAAPIAGAKGAITRNWGLGTNGNLQVQGSGFFGAASIAPTAFIHAAGATTSNASIRIGSGTAPTSPNQGDLWNDGTNLFFYSSSQKNAVASNFSIAAPATTGTMTTTLTNVSTVTITPTGACTFNASGGIAGADCTFVITTSGTSAFTLTWGTNFKSTGTLSTGTVTAKVFTVSFRYDGTNWNETARTTAM